METRYFTNMLYLKNKLLANDEKKKQKKIGKLKQSRKSNQKNCLDKNKEKDSIFYEDSTV